MLQHVSELAARTPDERNRYVDFLRVLAIAMVVLGHWLIIDVRLDEGIPTGQSALVEAEWIHWGTWVFQVIPIFFLVGGYANAVSWRAHGGNGGDWASWVRRRALRLLWPTAVFVAVGLVGTALASAAGVPEALLDDAGWVVAIILWFLAAYLAVAALTPLAVRAHDRWGLGFVAVLVGAVVCTEAVRFLAGTELLAHANHALVWGAFHQLGFAWHDGSLVKGRRPVALAAVSAVALVVLVVAGPYPVSMVGVPGAEVQNTAPPSLALLFLGFAQAGLALAVRGWMVPRLADGSLWTAVVAGNLAAMSIFLWHVVPVIVLATMLPVVGASPPGPPGSMQWLAFRPVWILLLTVVLVPIVALARLVERPPAALESLVDRRGRPVLGLVVALAGVAVVSAALAALALDGFWAGEAGRVPVGWAGGFFAGAVAVVGSGALPPRPAPLDGS